MLHALRVRPFAQRWLLALMLLLPLAQGAAWLHTLSHATGGAAHAAEHEGSEGLVQDLCDLCLTAAHLAGSAPGPVGLPMLVQASASVQPVGQPPAAVSAAPLWRRGARGPPGADAMSAALLS